MRFVVVLAVLAALTHACGGGPSAEVQAACDEWIEVASRHEEVIGEPAEQHQPFAGQLLSAGRQAGELGGDFEDVEDRALVGAQELVQLEDKPIPRTGNVVAAISTARQHCIREGAWHLCEGRWRLTGSSTDEICGE